MTLLHYSLSNTITVSPENEYAEIESSSSVVSSVCSDSSEAHLSKQKKKKNVQVKTTTTTTIDVQCSVWGNMSTG